ncbi:hypothetical protein LAL01_01430 [Companilactobacillus alimentarius]|nr:hypothetical protein LAL01_01430 [Companilactobacillus alimentarius]
MALSIPSAIKNVPTMTIAIDVLILNKLPTTSKQKNKRMVNSLPNFFPIQAKIGETSANVSKGIVVKRPAELLGKPVAFCKEPSIGGIDVMGSLILIANKMILNKIKFVFLLVTIIIIPI